MSLSKFFNGSSNEQWNPLYTINPLQTKSHPLNLTRQEIISKSEEELVEYVEKLRLEILNLFYNHKTPTAFGSSSLDSIKRKLKQFDRNSKAMSTIAKVDNGKKFLMCMNKSGLVVNFWFPEMVSTRIASAGNKSVIDGIENGPKFLNNFKRIVIANKMYLWGKMGEEANHLRLFPTFSQGIRLGTGSQSVVNFLPIIAKWVYKHELSRWKSDNELYVMDTSCGWGGRSLGLISASQYFLDKQIKFIGTDPNTDISPHRYEMFYNFFNENVRSLNNMDMTYLTSPAELLHENDTFTEHAGKGHVVLTSPPYFNRELYGSAGQEQSHSKYGQYEDWRDGFLTGLLKNVYTYLKPGGRFYLNIADIKMGNGYLPLSGDSVKIGESFGFKHVETIYMVLTSAIGNNKNKRPEFFKNQLNMTMLNGEYKKTEPILVLEK